MPSSQEIKVEKCSDSAIPNSLAVGLSLATWLEWSTVTQKFWVRIVADPKIFPFGIVLPRYVLFLCLVLFFMHLGPDCSPIVHKYFLEKIYCLTLKKYTEY